MCEQDHALWREPSLLRRCFHGSVSVTVVVELICMSCASGHHSLATLSVATEELLLICLRVDRNVRTPNHALIWLFQQPHLGMSIFLESGTLVALMAPEEVTVPKKKHGICGGPLRHSCSRNQTEVVAPLRQFSTVLDVENHVLGILHILCTQT